MLARARARPPVAARRLVRTALTVAPKDAPQAATLTRLPHRSDLAVATGAGGRSSTNGHSATVFGCSGFIGRYLVNRLGRTGTQTVVPFRSNVEDVRHLRPMGDLGRIVPLRFDLRYHDQIRACVAHADTVYNLVGRNWDTKNFTLEQVHIEGARLLARLAREAGAAKFVHFSALGADADSPSRLLRVKALGEQAVLSEFPDATIVRPASVFGYEDRFYTRVGYLHRVFGTFLPVVNRGETRVRPVYVGDVAAVAAQLLTSNAAVGRTVELYSPVAYEYRAMIELFAHYAKRDVRPLPLPESVATLLARFHNLCCYGAPTVAPEEVARDMVDERPTAPAQRGTVAMTFADFGIVPSSIEAHAISFTRVFRPNHLAGVSIEHGPSLERFKS